MSAEVTKSGQKRPKGEKTMKTLMSTLMALSFALVLVACGDPGEFEDLPEDGMQQEGGGDW